MMRTTSRLVTPLIANARSTHSVQKLRTTALTIPRRNLTTNPADLKAPPPPHPPPPPPKSGGLGAPGLLAILAGVGGAIYYFRDSLTGAIESVEDAVEKQNKLKQQQAKAAITPVLKTPAAAPAAPTVAPASAAATPAPTAPSPVVAEVKKEVVALEGRLEKATPKPIDWKLLRSRIVDLLDDNDYDDGSWGPVFVRLAWHTSGTYDKNTKRGGSEGSGMRFEPESNWGANAGLHLARARLDVIKKEFPDLSYGDLWSYAGTVAIEEMGGPEMISKWKKGRKDLPAPPAVPLPDGLLPDADGRDKKANPAEHVRDIFYRMGFDDREIVALLGGHALGRCHTDRSGYDGPWTFAPTTFSNEFFKLLLSEKWQPKTKHDGKLWSGPFQYEDAKTQSLMMLPTDYALIQDAKMKAIVEEYAKDEKKFFADFAKAWLKLNELGVRSVHGTRKYYIFGPRE